MAILKFAASALAMTLVACQRDPTLIELSEQHVVVHALLIAGDDSARVLVARPSTTDPFGLPNGISNARVRLVAPDRTITIDQGGVCVRSMSFDDDTSITNTGCYTAAVPGGIVHGAPYEIEIAVPGQPIIHGMTQVPAAPVVESPSHNSEISFASGQDTPMPFPIAWSVADPNARVAIHLSTGDTDCRVGFRSYNGFGVERWLGARGSGDTTAAVGFWDCMQPPDRLAAELVVTVFDANYDAYLHRREAVPFNEASVGLTGAFGLFGSAARSAISVVLIRQ